MIGEWIGHIKGETRHGERVERRTNFDGQIVRKQRSICRVRWSSNVTCQQAKNKVVFFCVFFLSMRSRPVAVGGELGEGTGEGVVLVA